MPTIVEKIIKYNQVFPANLRDLKFKAMADNSFGFYRGTCHLFAEDFIKLYGFKNKVRSWVCGDLHFENFGSYKGENRQVYFDINDFDEAILGIPEIDVCRFVTSIIIAGRIMKASPKQIRNTADEIIAIYRDKLRQGKALLMEKEVAHGVFRKYFEKLESRNRNLIVKKLTQKNGNKISLKIDGTHFLSIDEKEKGRLYRALNLLLKQNTAFRDLEFVDAAFRIAGTGSLGLKRYCVLCFNKLSAKYYFIDIKQSRRSCYLGFENTPKQPKFGNQSDRIIFTESLMEFCPPYLLTPLKIGNDFFVVRELQPKDDKMKLEDFGSDFTTLSLAAKEMSALIAYAHLRSSGHNKSDNADKLMTFALKNKWKDELTKLCFQLADNNSKYYDEFIGYVSNADKKKKTAL